MRLREAAGLSPGWPGRAGFVTRPLRLHGQATPVPPAGRAYDAREESALDSVMRHGDQYVESLRDGRAVFLDGERVADVTKHPAFVEPIRRIADRYDAAR